MKILFTLSIYLFLTNAELAAGSVEALCNNIKIRDVKFKFTDAQPGDFWEWIQLNLDSVASSQVEWGTRGINEKISLKVISGIREKLTINGNMSLLQAINIALEKYKCVALIGYDPIVVIPKSIQLDYNRYEKVDGAIYRIKSE
jgi:hypothetical protein